MRIPPIDQKTARNGYVDVVVAQQLELIEYQQETCGVSAGVDAIELPVSNICSAPARTTWFAVPATGPTRRSNQAPAAPIALRSAAGDDLPPARICASFTWSLAVRSSSVWYLHPKP
jgi:hypothetical protein